MSDRYVAPLSTQDIFEIADDLIHAESTQKLFEMSKEDPDSMTLLERKAGNLLWDLHQLIHPYNKRSFCKVAHPDWLEAAIKRANKLHENRPKY